METATAGTWLYVAKSPSGSNQSGRGTQVGTLGAAWSAQVDHGGSGDAQGCCGESSATTFLDRVGNVYYLRAGSFGEKLYWKRSSDGGLTWTSQLQLYEALPNYLTGAPVGLYVPGYTFGEYIWFAGFGGTEDTLRVVPLRTSSSGAELPDPDLLYGTTTYSASGSGLAGVDFALAFDGDDATGAVFSQVNNSTSQLVVTLPAGAATIRSIKVKMTVLHLMGLSGGGSVRMYCGSGALLWQENGANVHVVNTGRIDVSDCVSGQLTLWWSHANGGTSCGETSDTSCLYTLSAWSYGLGAEAGPLPYAQTGTARLLGSAGGDLDPGAAYPYNFGHEVRSLGAGSYTTSAVDLELPGRLLPFVFARTYNSADSRVGVLGPGWTHSFEWSLTENGELVILRRGDGRQDRFVRQVDDTYTREPGVFDNLTRNPDGTFTLTLRDQRRYEFSSTGALARIHEPAGNEISLAYVSGRLSAITDTVGRQVSLTYDSSGRLTQLRDPAGRRVRYEYDGDGRLASVRDRVAMDGASSYRGTVLDDVPVAYWRLGEGAGLTALDETSTQNGTYSAAGVTYGVAPGIVDSDTAINVNGSGYMTAGGSGPLDITGPAVSVEAWVRGGGQGTYKYIVSKSDGNGTVGYSLYTGSTGRLHFFVNTTGSGLRMATAPTSPWTGAWRHVIGSYDGSTVRLYVDGSQVASTGATGAIRSSSTRPLDVGRFNGGGFTFNGDVDDVAVYSTALSTQEVADHYTAGLLLPSPSWQYGYDAGSRHLATVTDPDGRVLVTNLYDSLGRLSSQTDGAGNTSTFSYAPSQMAVTDPRGSVTTLAYDPRNRVITRSSLVESQPVAEEYVYDGCGTVSAVFDRNGERTDYSYDPECSGDLLERLDPQIDPQVPRYATTFEYDLKGNVTREVDARGFETTHTYDGASNVRLSTNRQVDATTYATTKYEYGDAANPGLVTRVISPRGNATGTPDYAYATTLAYDSQGNLVSSTDADGNVTTHGYDALGRRISTVDPDGNASGGVPADHEWTTSYDLNDRIIGETDPLGKSVIFGYDGAGNRTIATDRNGNVTTYIHDAASRLWKVQQKPEPIAQPSLVYTTTVARDANGNVTRVTQANGVITDRSYDELDRVTTVTTHPAAGVDLSTSYTIDGNGNVTSRTRADGVLTDYTYDAMSRLTSVAAAGLTTITYSYDAASNRTSMSDEMGLTTYTYDGLGRLTEADQPHGIVGYGYDADSNSISLTYPGSRTVQYTFSKAGRLTGLADWDGRATGYGYTPAGLPSTVTLPSTLGGLVTTYVYDRAQRLTDLTNVVGANAVSSHELTLDDEGDRTSLSEFVSGITPAGQVEQFGMTYDGLLRLTGITTTNTESFVLDAASNVSARTGPSASYTYDAADRLTGDGTQVFTWSDADRLVWRGSDSFTYDALDRLTGSSVAGTSRTYSYNGDGLLQARTDAGTTVMLWDASSSPSRLLEQGTDTIIHGLGPLYVIRADGSTATLAADHLGSIRAELDASGAVTGSYRYRAYGDIAQSSGTGPTYLGYAGEILDSSGLIYLRARWYDPTTGRFLTRDPLAGSAASPRTLNGYGYAGASPSNLVDPSGLAFDSVDAGPAVNMPGDLNELCLLRGCGGGGGGGGTGGSAPVGRGTVGPVVQPTFASLPSGRAVQVPPGWTVRETINGRGLLIKRPGSPKGADEIRLMDPSSRYPDGYMRYTNSSGQYLDRHGRVGDRASTHIPLDYTGPLPGLGRFTR